MKKTNVDMDQLPLGLGMALAKRNGGMQYFTSLDKNTQQDIVAQAKTMQSKQELNSYVNSVLSDMSTN